MSGNRKEWEQQSTSIWAPRVNRSKGWISQNGQTEADRRCGIGSRSERRRVVESQSLGLEDNNENLRDF